MGKKITDEDIGRKIREARTDAGLRQEDLGERLGVTLQSISNYERGLTPITVMQLYAIAKACGRLPQRLLP